jgi:CDP-diacylglycerol--glycerol-3-phosphate 3-phosphatidyltransferase
MVVLSLASAIDYFWAFWRKIDRQVVKSQRRRAFILSRRRKRDVAPT